MANISASREGAVNASLASSLMVRLPAARANAVQLRDASARSLSEIHDKVLTVAAWLTLRPIHRTRGPGIPKLAASSTGAAHSADDRLRSRELFRRVHWKF